MYGVMTEIMQFQSCGEERDQRFGLGEGARKSLREGRRLTQLLAVLRPTPRLRMGRGKISPIKTQAPGPQVDAKKLFVSHI